MSRVLRFPVERRSVAEAPRRSLVDLFAPYAAKTDHLCTESGQTIPVHHVPAGVFAFLNAKAERSQWMNGPDIRIVSPPN